jgi:hypothetical protein
VSKYVKHMTTQLEKLFFNKKTTCLLTGLQEHQLDYFIKRAKMIENKVRYSMNDIIYISICHSLKIVGLNWLEITNFINKSFNTIVDFRSIDFVKYDFFSMTIKSENITHSFIIKDEFASKRNEKEDYEDILKITFINNEKNIMFTSNCIFIEMEDNTNIYIILIYKIIKNIIKKSKELNLKIDVEHILLSA